MLDIDSVIDTLFSERYEPLDCELGPGNFQKWPNKSEYKKDPTPQIAASKKWNTDNRDRFLANQNKRRAKKLRAVPSWAESEKAAIQEIYNLAASKTKLTGIKHHVDHIVPLNSPIVQGLHCFANLQILTGAENISKSNKFWPDMPEDK